MNRIRIRLLAALLLTSATAMAQNKTEDKQPVQGFLCCNMRSDGSWMNDINYVELKQRMPLGTPVKVTGQGRQRIYLEINGKKHTLANDYSRDLSLDDFTKRYVVPQDPKLKLAGYPANIQTTITKGRLTKGMTREQVLMAVGYPVSSETPDLSANLWKFWLSSFEEYRVKFDANGIVTEIEADNDDIRDAVVRE